MSKFVWIASALALAVTAWIGISVLKHRTQAYDSQFYSGMDKAAVSSAKVLVPELVRIVRPRSVVDVGSGSGSWSLAFLRNGVADVVAIDGPWVERASLKIPAGLFVERNLDAPLRLDRTFDMALCLETAEHLRPERAAGFVHDLTALAPVVVFSAAIPGQGGTLHYNERWQDYWAALFHKNGYIAIDALRPRFWNDARISAMYRQNTILYVRGDRIESSPNLRELAASSPHSVLPLVHPEVLRNCVDEARVSARWQTRLKRALHIE